MQRTAAATALSLLFLASCSGGSGAGSLSFVTVSGPAPQVSAPTLQGGRFGTADYAGQILVVNFWNQDCPPCRQEMPVLQRDSVSLASRGVVVVGVLYVGGNWPNDLPAARAFLRELGVTYPTVLDPSSALATGFAIPGIPTTVVVDRSGQLRFRVLGRVRTGELGDLVSNLAKGGRFLAAIVLDQRAVTPG